MASMAKSKALDFLASLAQETGVSFDKEEQVKSGALLKDDSRFVRKETLKAVMQQMHRPHEFRFIRCKTCGSTYKTNSCQVAYCSETCMIKSLKDRFGIIWSEDSRRKSLDGFERPLTVDADTSRQIYDWAREYIQGYEYIDRVNDEPKQNPTRPRKQYVRYTPAGTTVVEYAEVSSQEFPLPEVPKMQTDLPEKEEIVSEELGPLAILLKIAGTAQVPHQPELPEKYPEIEKPHEPLEKEASSFEWLFS